MVYGWNGPYGNENIYKVDVPCDRQVFRLEIRGDTSDLSIHFLNQYSLSSMNERWGDLLSKTCFAGSSRVTSHSESNSITLVSNLGRTG